VFEDRRPWGLSLLLACALLVACSSETPTSLLLEIKAGEGVGQLDDLRLSIYGASGLELSSYRLPATGAPKLPASTVLYPPTAGELRLAVRGRRGSAVVAEGIARADVVAGTQSRASLLLELGRALDSDGDGVPDAIDRCPQLPDPDQSSPCPDGGIPDGGDAADLSKDLGADGPHDSFVPPDIIKSCTKATECDDGNPCTDDRCEQSKCTYGPTICKPSGNPCKKAPRCDAQLGCVEDDQPDNTPCPDSAFCTIDEVCVAGTCQSSARDCQSGAPTCSVGSCDEAKNSCTFKSAPLGTSCDDGDTCTQGDACTATGSCEPEPTALELIEKVNLNPRGDRTIVLDSKGAAHAVYVVGASTGPFQLQYATNASGSWVLQTLEGPTPDALQHVSLAIDGQDRLHAVFALAGQLHYRRWSSGGIILKEVVTSSTGHTALVLDKSGDVYVAHQEGRSLSFAQRSAGTWQPKSKLFTPNDGNTTLSPSIALDNAGKVHIAHARRLTNDYSDWLWHSSNELGSWVTATIDSGQGVGNTPSILITPNNVVHVLHGQLGASNDRLRLATRATSATKWSHQTLTSMGKTGSFGTLVRGTKGTLHAVYRNWGQNELRLVSSSGGAWGAPQVIAKQGSGTGRWASAVIAPSGRIHVLYEIETQDLTRYASFSACP
jgi:hypothetical protein